MALVGEYITSERADVASMMTGYPLGYRLPGPTGMGGYFGVSPFALGDAVQNADEY